MRPSIRKLRSGFEWDVDNIFHIEKRWRKSSPVTAKSGERAKRYIALGETLGGRLAFVVFRLLSGGLV